MSVVITAPTPSGKTETVILLRYSNTKEPMPPLDVERAKRAVAKGRGVKTSELAERKVGE